jgi:hypothetical protein
MIEFLIRVRGYGMAVDFGMEDIEAVLAVVFIGLGFVLHLKRRCWNGFGYGK